MIWKFVFQTARNMDTTICRSLNGSIVSNQWEREICRYPMNELKDLRTRSKEVETRSWTQKDPEGKMSDDEARHLEREEKEKEVETRSWTQKDLERKMSDDEARHLEREEKEVEIRRKQMEEREKEIEGEKVKKDREKVAKKNRKEERSDEDCRRFTLQARTKAPTPERGLTYAKVDTWKVDTWKNAKKACMNEKDMGMTLIQATNQEGWSNDRFIQTCKKIIFIRYPDFEQSNVRTPF